MKTARLTAATCSQSNAHGLTLAQQNGVDLLAAGKNDAEAAAALALDLHRVTVTRWRLYSFELIPTALHDGIRHTGGAADYRFGVEDCRSAAGGMIFQPRYGGQTAAA